MANTERSLRSAPMIGAAAALAALIGAPLAKNWADRGVAAPTAPVEYQRVADAVDAFWRREYDAQFPDARSAYSPPRTVFKDLSAGHDFIEGQIVGYYDERWRRVTVDTDKDLAFVALVVAHEFGHHVQFLSGWNALWSRERIFADWRKADQLDVRYELQAECLAGVWAHDAVRDGAHLTRRSLDRLRRADLASEDSETHGTAEQRHRWFENGFSTGDAAACDTFAPDWRRL